MSLAKHPRNVSLDGHPCYACEAPRLPACTEAPVKDVNSTRVGEVPALGRMYIELYE